MTIRDIWERLLIELSKEKAPSLLLDDFNYFVNKAINQYVNKRYNIYDVNQQTSDDLRVLKATSILDVIEDSSIIGTNFKVILPQDYLHLLNCICVYKVNGNYKCHKDGEYVQFPTKRLTADIWPMVLEDYYNKPRPEMPYYYIHNINRNQSVPTNPLDNGSGTDMTSNPYSYTVDQQGTSNLPRTIILNDGITQIDSVNREIGYRYGNASEVRMEIRNGKQNPHLVLFNVLIDYLKTPQYVELTRNQLDLIEDTSQIMEFPDYVCQEIINELVMLIMNNTADPRLATNLQVTQSIAPPIQQQANS